MTSERQRPVSRPPSAEEDTATRTPPQPPQRQTADDLIDEASAESFPASDAPARTSTVGARVRPAVNRRS